MRKKGKKIFLLLTGIFIGVISAVPKDIVKADNPEIQLVSNNYQGNENLYVGNSNITFVFVSQMNSYINDPVASISGNTILTPYTVKGGKQSFILRPAILNSSGRLDDSYGKYTGTDFAKDNSGGLKIDFKINSQKNNTYVFTLNSSTDYFYFEDKGIMEKTNTYNQVSLNNTGSVSANAKNSDKWFVQFTSADGREVQISRNVKYKTNLGYYKLNICVSSENPNIIHDMGNTATVFDGTHQASIQQAIDPYALNIGGYTLNLDNAPVVGQRLADVKENVYDKIRDNVRRFNRLIKIATMWVYGIAIFVAMIALMSTIFKLAISNSHPLKRYEAYMNILTCVICIALLGSISLITNLILALTVG